MVDDDELLRYYWQELTYLRKMGEVFSRRYPKVAARLELEPEQSADPHVERLIESFAFLTGRIQRDLDADFPEIAAELLSILYPQLLLPIPSLSIARFDVDPDRGKLTTGYQVPAETQLFATARHGRVCRFRTCYPVELWPLEVTDAAFERPEAYDFLDAAGDVSTVLRLRVESRADPLADLEIQSLRFFINGDPILVGRLYELIFNNTLRLAIRSDGQSAPTYLSAEAIRAVGFGVDDVVLPYPVHAQPAVRLLQEYFVLPECFHFFDLTGLDTPGCRADGAMGWDIFLLLNRTPEERTSINAETFALGCTPIINLFHKTTEPIRVDHRQLYYRLVPDLRRAATTEIHSILSVSGSSELQDQSRDYAPFYSYDHAMAQRGQRTFWHGKRVRSMTSELEGTDIQLAFYDLDWKPSLPPDEVVYAHTLCTNRRLAEQIPAGGLLQTDEAIPAQRIVCLKRPTRQLTPPMDGANLWRLVSHLSLNYLSTGSGPQSLKALQEILRLYAVTGEPSVEHQIQGLRAMEQRKVMRRLGNDSWRGFCRGNEITLTLDESLFVGSSAFLFAAVIRQFFALYATTNSFTQTVIKKSHEPKGEWRRWPPMAGEKAIL